MGAVAFAGLIALSIILLRTLRARKVQRQADQASTAQGKLNLSSSAWHRHACIFLQPCFHTSCNWRGRCRVLPCLQLCTLQCPIARKHSLTHSLTHPHMFAGPFRDHLCKLCRWQADIASARRLHAPACTSGAKATPAGLRPHEPGQYRRCS